LTARTGLLTLDVMIDIPADHALVDAKLGDSRSGRVDRPVGRGDVV
jgi:hypothetical protein